MEERFETFTVLITRISRSIKRIKAAGRFLPLSHILYFPK